MILKCKTCGATLDIKENGKFVCEYCGSTQLIEMKGNENNRHKSDSGQFNKLNDSYEKTATKTATTNEKWIVVSVSIIAFLIIAAVTILCCVMLISNNSETKPSSKETNMELPMDSIPTSKPMTTPTPLTREQTYNSQYSYRFNEIPYATDATDDEMREVAECINRYNQAWIDYINYGNQDVFLYIRPDSKAYKNAVNYGKKSITEDLMYCKTINVMKYENYYFAWTNEHIKEYENGSETNKYYNWIYRVYTDGYKLYIEDYTQDPRYK